VHADLEQVQPPCPLPRLLLKLLPLFMKSNLHLGVGVAVGIGIAMDAHQSPICQALQDSRKNPHEAQSKSHKCVQEHLKNCLQLGADYMAYYMFARIERCMRLLRKFHNFEDNNSFGRSKHNKNECSNNLMSFTHKVLGHHLHHKWQVTSCH
jgi:hypothetical protein